MRRADLRRESGSRWYKTGALNVVCGGVEADGEGLCQISVVGLALKVKLGGLGDGAELCSGLKNWIPEADSEDGAEEMESAISIL